MTPKQARVTILGNLAVWNVNGIIDQLESEYEKGVLREIVGAAEQLAKSTGWISVKDRLPDRNTPILITANGKVYTATLFDANGIEYWSVNNRGNSYDPSTKVERVKAKAITHWMPLPEPPEVTE